MNKTLDELPSVVYHGTTTEHLDSIRQGIHLKKC